MSKKSNKRKVVPAVEAGAAPSERIYLDEKELRPLAERFGLPIEEIRRRANKLGFTGMFATPESAKAFNDYYERAAKAGHVSALLASVGMLNNYWALRWLERDLKEEKT